MVRESETRSKSKRLRTKTTAQPASSTVRDAIEKDNLSLISTT